MLTRTSLTIRLHPNDDVVIARQQLLGGTLLAEESVTVAGLVPPGHKVATRAVRAGEPVRRYNQIIGVASRDIAPGEHVHLNNLAMGAFERDYAFGADAKPTAYVDPPASFQGIVRADGRVATRNYVGILSTVNCSATVVRGIADHFTRGALAAFANVDGVVALTITVCRLAPNKRVDHAIEATRLLLARKVPAHLTVVGTGDGEASLDEMVHRAGIAAHRRESNAAIEVPRSGLRVGCGR